MKTGFPWKDLRNPEGVDWPHGARERRLTVERETEPDQTRLHMLKILDYRVMGRHEKYFKERGKVIRFAFKNDHAHCQYGECTKVRQEQMLKEQLESYYCSPGSRWLLCLGLSSGDHNGSESRQIWNTRWWRNR